MELDLHKSIYNKYITIIISLNIYQSVDLIYSIFCCILCSEKGPNFDVNFSYLEIIWSVNVILLSKI